MLHNQIALVSGAIGDIGTAIAIQLNRLGAKVIGTYHSNETKALAWQKEQRKQGFDVEVVHVDVASFESCVQMHTKIVKEWGDIDILVNNAGITLDVPLRKMTEEQWNQVIQADLSSIFNMTRQVINNMIEKNYGRIINIASINGQRGQFGQTNYTAAKAGIHGFTKSLALEVGKKGITVNTISPGYIEGKMIQAVPEVIRNQILNQIPVGRFGKVEEVAWIVGCIASKESAYINGADISMNGGLHMC